MKSVPNSISYLHEFFQNFSQSLAIRFELFSFGVIFNSEIADERAPPVRRRPPLPRGCHALRRCRDLKPLSGQRAARPDSRPRSRRPPDRLAGAAVAPTTSLAARPSPSCRAAVSAPVSRLSPPSPVRRCRAAVGSPCSGVAEPRRHRAAPPPRTCAVRHALRGPSELGHTALCIWAERSFGPVAPG
jgi:hypothetical protein